MKIEVGKEYGTRCGDVYKIVHYNNSDRTFLGVTDCGFTGWFRRNGQLIGNRKEKLILEPPKRVKVERWVNVYPDGDINSYKSREEADEFELSNRFACKHVEFEVEEGEGL